MDYPFTLRKYLRNPIKMLRFRYFEYRRFRPWKGPLRRRLKGSSVRLFLNPQDVGISKDLYIYGSREESATSRLLSYLKPGMTILDIGANIGYFALLEARIVGSTGKIYAIEPDTKNLELLGKSVVANNLQDIVEVTGGAVGNENGTATLHVATRSNLHTLTRVPIMDNYVEFQETVEVPVFTIDSFIQERGIDPTSINLIRMDIEGFEYAALEGMRETLDSAMNLLMFIEIHPKLIKASIGIDGYRAFLDNLQQQRFKIVGASASLSSRVDENIDLKEFSELLEYEEAVELFLARGSVLGDT